MRVRHAAAVGGRATRKKHAAARLRDHILNLQGHDAAIVRRPARAVDLHRIGAAAASRSGAVGGLGRGRSSSRTSASASTSKWQFNAELPTVKGAAVVGPQLMRGNKRRRPMALLKGRQVARVPPARRHDHFREIVLCRRLRWRLRNRLAVDEAALNLAVRRTVQVHVSGQRRGARCRWRQSDAHDGRPTETGRLEVDVHRTACARAA